MTNSIIPFLVFFASASSPSLLFGQGSFFGSFHGICKRRSATVAIRKQAYFGHHSEQSYLTQSERL